MAQVEQTIGQIVLHEPEQRIGEGRVVLLSYFGGKVHEPDVRCAVTPGTRLPREKVEGEYFNIGDMVVYDSTLKMLDA